MKAVTNIAAALIIFALPVFSYGPGVDFAGENFAIEACSDSAFGGFFAPSGEKAVL